MQLPDTPENRTFLTNWLQLILTVYNEPFTSDDLNRINEAIEGNYELEPEHRTLEHIAPFLGLKTPGSLAARLEMWYGKGNRANLFGNQEDLLKLDQNFFGFEMGEILEDKVSLPSVLSYLFHRIELELNGQPTIIVLEEGSKLLDNPYLASRIKDWLQTLRKKMRWLFFSPPILRQRFIQALEIP